jgi:hypothetical protein
MVVVRLVEPASFAFTVKISAKREAPDVATFDESIAEGAMDEEKGATDGCLAAGRKLTGKVNEAVEPGYTARRSFFAFSSRVKALAIELAEGGVLNLIPSPANLNPRALTRLRCRFLNHFRYKIGDVKKATPT